MNNFVLRTITGAVFVIVIIGSVIIHHWVFAGLFLVIAALGYLEFSKIARVLNYYPSRIYGTVLAALTYCVIVGYNYLILPGESLLLLILVPIILLSIELARKTSTALANVATAVFGIVWIVIPLALLSGFFNLAEEHKWRETGLLLGFFLIVWIYDSGAYIFGSLFGKHRILERISPKKSWEGLAGGVLVGMLVAYMISASFTEFSLTEWLLIAIAIVVSGTLGDLAESMIKRNAGIKDSGNLLPGHGGVLDRFDAVLLAAPVIYILVKLLRFIN